MRTAIVVAALAAAASAGAVKYETVDVTVTSCPPDVPNCPYKAGATAWIPWSAPPPKPTTTPCETKTVPPKGCPGPECKDDSWKEWKPAATTAPVKPVPCVECEKPAPPKGCPGADCKDDSWKDWKPAPTTAVPVKPVPCVECEQAKKPAPPAVTTAAPPKSTAPCPTTALCPAYTLDCPPEWFGNLPKTMSASMADKWANGAPADWCYYTYSKGWTTATPVPDMPVKPTMPAAATTPCPTTPAAPTGTANAWSPWVSQYTGAANAKAGSVGLAGIMAVAALVLA